MKFKVGDKVKCKAGTILIWVTPGKVYEVLSMYTNPPQPGNVCYRNCGHPMHDPKPAMTFIEVIGNKGKCSIYEGCFVKVKK